MEEDMFKLMNNAIYGKTLENVRGHSNSKLIFDKKEMDKVFSSRYFKSAIVISDSCVLVNNYKK